jgi:hypothetical protein
VPGVAQGMAVTELGIVEGPLSRIMELQVILRHDLSLRRNDFHQAHWKVRNRFYGVRTQELQEVLSILVRCCYLRNRDTPGGSQQLNFILLMWYSIGWSLVEAITQAR